MSGPLFAGIGGHHSARPKTTTTWLTPPHITAALGGPESFDLDPCGYPGWPTARHAYCLPQDGLRADWGTGRIYLCPPYTNAEIGRWMKRLADHGRGTALISARTETAFFAEQVWGRAHGLLFLAGRLYFHHADGRRASANSGAPSVLCAYGQDDLDRLAACDLEGSLVPLRFARFVVVEAFVDAPASWREIVAAHMGDGPVSVSDLYRALARHPKTTRNRNWRAKVRQTLRRGAFRRVGRGLWARAA